VAAKFPTASYRQLCRGIRIGYIGLCRARPQYKKEEVLLTGLSRASSAIAIESVGVTETKTTTVKKKKIQGVTKKKMRESLSRIH